MSNGTQSIDRAAEILSLVVTADEPISYTDVVEATSLARSTVSRVAVRARAQRPRRTQLRRPLPRGIPLRDVRLPLRPGRDPRRRRRPDPPAGERGDGETVNLAVPSSNAVVQVAQVDSTFVLGATNWADVTVPAHASALGKVMYAFGAIPVPTGRLERLTQRTLGSRRELMSDLAEVRDRGFAVVHEEFEPGLDALAAPVFGTDDQVVAAVGISGPTMRIAENHDRFGELLVAESGLLSRPQTQGQRPVGRSRPLYALLTLSRIIVY